jgi:hypothetical protein
MIPNKVNIVALEITWKIIDSIEIVMRTYVAQPALEKSTTTVTKPISTL